MNKKPNILFIGSDQHRFDCVGVNGNPVIKTPNLDKLAATGMNFTNAYTPCPICTPARVSLLTGQWSFKHLNITIDAWTEVPRVHKEGLPTFSEQLKANGYFLGYLGKWHMEHDGKMQPKDAGFDMYIPEGAYGRWRQEKGIPRSELRETGWDISLTPEKFDWLIRGGTDEYITPEQSKLHWGADTLIGWLEERVGKDEPFFLRWDPSEPHLTNVLPEPYASMYQPEDIPQWGSFAEDFHNKPYIQAQQLYSWGIQDWTWEDWAPVAARYYGEISLLDHEIGRVVEAVDRLGLRENTMIIYTTDHGDMCGSHRMMDKHYNMYDDVTRVPMVVNWPGVIEPGTYAPFVSHALDLAATLCDITGSGIPDTFQGQSLVPVLKEGQKQGRKDILSAYHGTQFGLYSQRMVRNEKWKYVWNLTAQDELYDMENDPWELENLAGESQTEQVLKEMRLRLAELLTQAEDPLLNVWTNFQLSYGRKI